MPPNNGRAGKPLANSAFAAADGGDASFGQIAVGDDLAFARQCAPPQLDLRQWHADRAGDAPRVDRAGRIGAHVQDHRGGSRSYEEPQLVRRRCAAAPIRP
jgi:hypothetical protein